MADPGTEPRSPLISYPEIISKYRADDWNTDVLVFLRSVLSIKRIGPSAYKVEANGPDGRGLRFLVTQPSFQKGQIVIVFLARSFLPAEAHPQFKALNCQHKVDGKLGVKLDFHLDNDTGLFIDGIIKPVTAFPEVADAIDSMTRTLGGDPARCSLANPAGGGDSLTYGLQLLSIDHLNHSVSFENMLGVKRWSHPVSETSMGPCPNFYKKSKVSRLAQCPNLFTKAKYKRLTYQVTEKIDGSSMAVYFISNDSPLFKALNPLPEYPGPHMELSNGRVGVCSMNVELPQTDVCPYWRAALRYNLPALLNAQNQDCVIQGELAGHGISQNRRGYPAGEIDFWVFDIFEPRIEGRWLTAEKVVTWCKEKNVQHVPVRLPDVKLRFAFKDAQAIQELADREAGEGLVFKCKEEPDRRFKVHSRGYLEKYGLN
ncbi:hypothetical protein MAPG_04431 [Magnaporthiopsis poae ATCC 64411]|uniref:RNA ligase domain-containing protein n=1 Tax=Magnaporthiopsis poae (strain ATCC 64411 / 73-15) TaxID=644358 RepID=A0A0C4DWQ1_MAGP6|nr:hypothetical protein MAPG_04431 [Magnaporthiopsis poae ATCC 64411]